MNTEKIPDFVRENLRDYILFITRLGMGNPVHSIEEIQLLAVHFVDAFDEKLSQQNVADSERLQIRYALLALVDETALRFLDSRSRLTWESAPLQVSQFGEYGAGEQLFAEIRTELQKPDISFWLLSVWRIVFALGFNGKYLFDDQNKKDELIAMIDRRLPEVTVPELKTNKRKLKGSTFYSFSPVTWCVVLLIISVIIYFILYQYLGDLVSQIV